jgi:hypothetical protein
MTPNRDDLRKLNTLKKFSRELAYSYKGLSEETKEFLNSEDKETLRNLNEFQRNVDDAIYILKKPSEDNYEHQKHRHRMM